MLVLISVSFYHQQSFCQIKSLLATTRNACQSPAMARQAQRTHPGEDTPLQRSNRAPAACATLSATKAFHPVHTAKTLWVHSAFLSLVVTLTF